MADGYLSDMTEGRIHIDGLKPSDVALLKQVASEAAELAVVKTFIAMGIDATKPLDAQADMLFLRSTRQRCESIGFKAVLTMMGLVMAGAAGLIWVGFKTSMKSSLPFALPLLLLLALAAAAFAQEHHERHHAHYQNWINQADKGCCNDQDCGELAGDNERETAAGIEVKIEGQWCPVKPQHYLKAGNAPDWSTAHICVQRPAFSGYTASPCDRLLCYQPKPGI